MSRRTIIYLVILVVLGGLLLARRAVDTGPEPIGYALPALPPETLTQVKLTWEGGEVTLRREGEIWVVAQAGYPADPSTVKALLALFEDPEPMDFEVSRDPEDQAEFELTEAQALRLEAYTDGETPAAAFYVGKSGPMGTQFIRPVGGAEIYRTKVGSVARFKKSPGEWRDKRALFIEKDDIAALTIRGAGGALEAKREGERWVAVSPEGLALDQAMVESMTRTLGNLRVAEILDAAPGDAGFGAPFLVAEVTLKGGGSAALTVGREAEAGQRYARREGDGQTFKVRTGSLSTLQKTPGELRDKALLTFAPGDLAGLTLSEGDRRVILQAGEAEGQWQVVEPPGAMVLPQTMAPVVTTLGSLRVSRFPGEIMAEAAGFVEGGFKVEVTLKGGEAHTLEIGGEAAGGERYGRLDGGEFVTLRESAVQSIRQLLPER